METTIKMLPDSERYIGLDSAKLRESFLIDRLFQTDKVLLNYVDLDRTVLGGIMPAGKSLQLEAPEILRADYFTERREVGVMNIGGSGSVEVDGKNYPMNFRDALYIGRGSRKIVFHSDDAAAPAKYYLISYPAHTTHPTTHARVKDAEPLHLGSDEACNKRTIYKYVDPGGIKSCQLVMGFTEMAPGNVWNTMPAHKHFRRTEVYCYFNLPDDAVVFHLMGPPSETRHLVVRNEQAAFSPGWSIHSGAGTSNYSFIWAMGGENLDYTDMDPVSMSDLR